MSYRVLCCSLFPALQRTLTLDRLVVGGVNRIRAVAESVGGKAVNTARVLKALGADPLLAGFSGGATGALIEQLLAAEGLAYVLVPAAAPSRTCQTLLAGDTEDFTELAESGSPPSGDELAHLADTLRAALPAMEAMVVSGTLPPSLSPLLYAEILPVAYAGPVILDTAGPSLLAALSRRPSLVKINAAELFASVADDSERAAGDGDVETAARCLLARGARAVGVTQGAGEAWLITPAHTFRYRLPALRVASTLGCGDAVNAGVVLALLRGDPLAEAFAFGLACGAANAMTRQPGVVDPTVVPQLYRAIRH